MYVQYNVGGVLEGGDREGGERDPAAVCVQCMITICPRTGHVST